MDQITIKTESSHKKVNDEETQNIEFIMQS